MKKTLIFYITVLFLNSCSESNVWSDYTPSVNTRGTMTLCIDKGLDDSPLIECSSARIEEQVNFCDEKARKQTGWIIRNLWHPLILSPFRTELHEAARIEQRCLDNTGIAYDNSVW